MQFLKINRLKALPVISLRLSPLVMIVIRLDYCNSPLVDCTNQTVDKLQWVFNWSARVTFGGDSRHHVTPLLHDHLHWLQARSTSRSNSAYWCIRQSTAWHHVTSTNWASQFQLFPTFLLSVPLLVVICSYPWQCYNSATRHFVWLVHCPVAWNSLHCTFVLHLHYQLSKMCSRHIFSQVLTSLTNFLLHWLTVSQSTSSKHCMAPL